MRSLPQLCPSGPCWAPELRTSSGSSVAGKFWANPWPPEEEAGGDAAVVGVGARCLPPRYLPSYFLDKWTQARLPG